MTSLGSFKSQIQQIDSKRGGSLSTTGGNFNADSRDFALGPQCHFYALFQNTASIFQILLCQSQLITLCRQILGVNNDEGIIFTSSYY